MESQCGTRHCHHVKVGVTHQEIQPCAYCCTIILLLQWIFIRNLVTQRWNCTLCSLFDSKLGPCFSTLSLYFSPVYLNNMNFMKIFSVLSKFHMNLGHCYTLSSSNTVGCISRFSHRASFLRMIGPVFQNHRLYLDNSTIYIWQLTPLFCNVWIMLFIQCQLANIF